MLESTIVKIPIQRAYEKAYDILCEPKNFPLWSPLLDARFEPAGNGGLDWLVELPASGTSILRFSPVNAYGVLDYTILTQDATTVIRRTALRLVRNEEGCDLVAQFFQRPGQADVDFSNYVEWGTNDLMVLKSVVETV